MCFGFLGFLKNSFFKELCKLYFVELKMFWYISYKALKQFLVICNLYLYAIIGIL